MATTTSQSRGNPARERILLRIDPAKKSAFLNMLKLFDFVEVEALEKQVNRYVQQAPDGVPLNEDDIQWEINMHRARKRR